MVLEGQETWMVQPGDVLDHTSYFFIPITPPPPAGDVGGGDQERKCHDRRTAQVLPQPQQVGFHLQKAY